MYFSGMEQEEFKKDVMQFLVSRGHGRLAASTDVETFPDAVLNGKRLDLYNLYKEVYVCVFGALKYEGQLDFLLRPFLCLTIRWSQEEGFM